jgi:hypothetical protein
MTFTWVYHPRPFRMTPGHGDGIYIVWDAAGYPAGVGTQEAMQRRMDGWNGLMEPTMERLLQDIDDMTSPQNMTPQQAKDFLERLSTEIEVRLDGIKDDLRNATGV